MTIQVQNLPCAFHPWQGGLMLEDGITLALYYHMCVVGVALKNGGLFTERDGFLCHTLGFNWAQFTRCVTRLVDLGVVRALEPFGYAIVDFDVVTSAEAKKAALDLWFGDGKKPLRKAKQKRRATQLSMKQRWSVLNRCGFKCFYCGASAGEGVILQVDHKVSVANGGTDHPDNLVAACFACNIGKGARNHE